MSNSDQNAPARHDEQRIPNPPPRRRRAAPPPPTTINGEDAMVPQAAPYDVGYGKPPVHTRFKKGQSGNPKGRPRGSESLTTLYREVFSEKITLQTAKGAKKVSAIRAMVMQHRTAALKGNLRALNKVLEMYEKAVPNRPDASLPDTAAELTATDIQMLAELRAEIQAELEDVA